MFCLILLILLFSRRRYWYGYAPSGYYGYPYGYGSYPYGAYSQYNPYWRGHYGYHRPYGWY